MGGWICRTCIRCIAPSTTCPWCRSPTRSADRSSTQTGWRPSLTACLTRSFRIRRTDGKYLAFLGRISPEKRPDRAIEIALRAGIPLKLAAKVDAVDQEYFDAAVKPWLDHPLIEFLGEIDDSQKSELLAGALALLFPIDWPEPFGLVMIEAMSAGTPVIAWHNGSVPEIVDPGVTGFIVQCLDEALEALNRVATLDRLNVRKRFKDRFTVDRMAENYLMLYRRLADDARSSSRSPAFAELRDGDLSRGLSGPRKRALSPVDLFEDGVGGVLR